MTKLDFGDYCTIEQERHFKANEMYAHKVIGTFKSNFYVDVPVSWADKGSLHDETVEVVACICCGVRETEVLRYRVQDVKPDEALIIADSALLKTEAKDRL